MKAHTFLRKVLAVVLILAVSMVSLQYADASKISKAKKARQAAKEALKVERRLMEKIEKKRKTLEKQIASVDAELVTVMTDLAITKDDISDKKNEIEQLKEQQAQTEQEVVDQREAIKKQVKFMYENNDCQVTEVVFKAKSISDLLNSVEYVNDIYDYSEDLLNNYKASLQKVTELKEEAESQKAELIAIKETYVEQKNDLKKLKAKKRAKLANYKTQLKKAKKLSVKYKTTIRKQNQIIKKEIARIKAEREAELERLRQAALEQARRQREAAAAAKAAAEKSEAAKAEQDVGQATAVSSSGSAAGKDIADYGCKFIGNKYVWGGTSLTNGCDCSGFVQQVYFHFGYTDCPRTSSEQRSYGREVSYSDAQPGDIICYSGHVGIYIGDGQIVNASNSKPYPQGGIKITTATYRTILSVRRVVD